MSEDFTIIRGREYHRCPTCGGIFLDPSLHPTHDEERDRYQKHQNDVDDPGYRAFVSPLVDAVCKDNGPDDPGLDFGCGKVPIVSFLLKERGYDVWSYDPFFKNDPDLLGRRYGYIASSEVIEHFHDPAKEFGLLRSILMEGGGLYCSTSIYSDSIDFNKWYYKEDPTHVFFYSARTMHWIKEAFSFSEVEIRGPLTIFRT